MTKQVDRMSAEINQLLATAPVYKKIGTVKARIAQSGEKVDTVLVSGVVETTNLTKEGDYIVTNPSGEEYIISGVKFSSRYEESDIVGVYNATGYCKAISNPYQESIEIFASWGEPQIGDDKCLFADTCDAKGDKMGNSPYLIDYNAFYKTYVLAQ
jgi:PGDYG protein